MKNMDGVAIDAAASMLVLWDKYDRHGKDWPGRWRWKGNRSDNAGLLSQRAWLRPTSQKGPRASGDTSGRTPLVRVTL